MRRLKQVSEVSKVSISGGPGTLNGQSDGVTIDVKAPRRKRPGLF